MLRNGTISLTGTTAAFFTPAGSPSNIEFHNDGAAKVYGKLNWKTGDTEVSATNFSIVIPAGGVLNIRFGGHPITNFRLLSASDAKVGYVSWDD